MSKKFSFLVAFIVFLVFTFILISVGAILVDNPPTEKVCDCSSVNRDGISRRCDNIPDHSPYFFSNITNINCYDSPQFFGCVESFTLLSTQFLSEIIAVERECEAFPFFDRDALVKEKNNERFIGSGIACIIIASCCFFMSMGSLYKHNKLDKEKSDNKENDTNKENDNEAIQL